MPRHLDRRGRSASAAQASLCLGERLWLISKDLQESRERAGGNSLLCPTYDSCVSKGVAG